ncbi:MAG: TrkH family potassium uptake protein [Mycoplasmatales bacterium]
MRSKYLKTLLGRSGAIYIGLSFFFLTPAISLFFYPFEYLEMINFIIPAFFCLGLGLIFKHKFKHFTMLQIPKSYNVFFVVYIWISTCLLMTIPFLLNGNLNFTQAFFEVTSGISTTGLSVVDVDNVEKIFLMYRSMTQYVGGLGIILIIIVLFGSSVGFDIYKTEGHTDSITPNFLRTAKVITTIYTTFILAGALCLWIAKMPLFDAINTSICAVATGGFGVRSSSIAYYESHLVNFIVIILMLLGSISFFAHFLLYKKKFRDFFKIDELKVYFVCITILVLLGWIGTLANASTLDLTSVGGGVLEQQLTATDTFSPFEIALFEIVSAISGTGFSIIDYREVFFLNHTFYFAIIIAMVIGGAIGSTAGGIKITRVTFIWKSLVWNTKKVYSANNKLINRSVMTPVGKMILKDQDVVLAANYIIVYLVTLIGGSIIFTLSGFPMDNSLFEVASALSNVGLTTGITSPTLAPYLLWTLSTLMFVGRLEIFIVIAFFLKILKFMKTSIKRTT